MVCFYGKKVLVKVVNDAGTDICIFAQAEIVAIPAGLYKTYLFAAAYNAGD